MYTTAFARSLCFIPLLLIFPIFNRRRLFSDFNLITPLNLPLTSYKLDVAWYTVLRLLLPDVVLALVFYLLPGPAQLGFLRRRPPGTATTKPKKAKKTRRRHWWQRRRADAEDGDSDDFADDEDAAHSSTGEEEQEAVNEAADGRRVTVIDSGTAAPTDVSIVADAAPQVQDSNVDDEWAAAQRALTSAQSADEARRRPRRDTSIVLDLDDMVSSAAADNNGTTTTAAATAGSTAPALATSTNNQPPPTLTPTPNSTPPSTFVPPAITSTRTLRPPAPEPKHVPVWALWTELYVLMGLLLLLAVLLPSAIGFFYVFECLALVLILNLHHRAVLHGRSERWTCAQLINAVLLVHLVVSVCHAVLIYLFQVRGVRILGILRLACPHLYPHLTRWTDPPTACPTGTWPLSASPSSSTPRITATTIANVSSSAT